MPKYIIWSPGRPRKTPIPADTVMLRLVLDINSPREVTLIACDQLGNRMEHGNLITLSVTGRLVRHSSINSQLRGRLALSPGGVLID